jgi:hypothetical protein
VEHFTEATEKGLWMTGAAGLRPWLQIQRYTGNCLCHEHLPSWGLMDFVQVVAFGRWLNPRPTELGREQTLESILQRAERAFC